MAKPIFCMKTRRFWWNWGDKMTKIMADNVISASPTKDFFIEMLTRDIKLEKAILDLIDNSIDGAKSLRPNEDFNGLWINLTLNETEFRIEDNCGGFPLEVAKKYAFRFGRPQGREETKHSVGRFGVGMKRALFKIGDYFKVESKCKEDHFLVEVDVNNWSQENTDWNFTYKAVENSEINHEEDGTTVVVSQLNRGIAEEFNSDIFLVNLKNEIERFLAYTLSKGITINLNGIKLQKSLLSILVSDNLKPIYKELSYENNQVRVKIFAGLGLASPQDAGWYIYCNERLVLERDKTNLTGWEGTIFKDSDTVKFHHTYAMFRGIVLFDADDSRLLPMTTTKTGIDANSPIYKAVRIEMISMMLPVIDFLKKLESDTDREIVTADSKNLDLKDIVDQVKYADKFTTSTIAAIREKNKYQTISYKKEKEVIERLKKVLNVNNKNEVGEKTFDYYLKMEVD